MQPDLACHTPELLLGVADWRRLGYLAEQPLERVPCLHSGSWILYGSPGRHALGRYFKARSSRYDEPLTQSVVTRKKQVDPDPVVERALRMIGELKGGYAGVDLVASIPPSDGGFDRLAQYREVAAEAYEATAADLLVNSRSIPGYKGMGHSERRKLSAGRFAADPKVVRGKHVLVLDDVITSGSTFDAAEEALKAAGVAEVSCLSFAATQD